MERVIIIPALNPDERLKEIINTNWDLENLVIVVDDGSGKEYQRIFQEISGKCIVLRHEKNRGKGAAIKTGLDYIEKEVWDCRIIGTMDADGQHCAEDMDRLMTKAAGHSDTLILGARRMDKTAPWRSRIGNFITRIVFSALTGKKVRDTQTGLRAFSRTLLEFMIQVPGERYEYETNVLIACVKKKIPILEEEVPAIYHDRKNSGSHFRKIKDSFRIYKGFAELSAAAFFEISAGRLCAGTDSASFLFLYFYNTVSTVNVADDFAYGRNGNAAGQRIFDADDRGGDRGIRLRALKSRIRVQRLAVDKF